MRLKCIWKVFGRMKTRKCSEIESKSMNSIGSILGIWDWVIVGLIAVLLFGKSLPGFPQGMYLHRRIDFVLPLTLLVLVIVFFVLLFTNFH
jgi:hypothetical protein